MPRYPMECGECGHMLDVDDARCAKCGVSRPATGWVALSQPRVRLVAVPGAYRGEVESVEPNDAPEPTEDPASAPPPVAADADKPLRLRMRSLPPAGEGPEDFDAFDLLGEDTAAPAPTARGVEARDLAPGKMYAARYRVEESLPSGPGALRFVAVQEPLVRRVVLTTLLRARPTDAQIALETRFLRDAAVLARLRHPNLAPVHDFGRGPDGACFATEELLYGFSLLYLSERGSVPPARLVAIAADVASALCALHEAGVVHRAVRADHVVVGPRTWRGGPGETAQLGRYGFEILPEEAASVTDVEAALLVTPEVLAGQEPDEACDIYAVGVLIYRALAGRPPY
jgi:hypothetical protein